MAQAFCASRFQTWTKVIMPAALGAVFTGLRLGLSRAISGMIVIELTLIPAGIGGEIVRYRSRFDAANLYATTLTIIAEGVILVGAARAIELIILRRLRGGAAL